MATSEKLPESVTEALEQFKRCLTGQTLKDDSYDQEGDLHRAILAYGKRERAEGHNDSLHWVDEESEAERDALRAQADALEK